MPKLFLFVLPVLVGCAAGASLQPLPPDHPASPEAAEAPVTSTSDTLRVEQPTGMEGKTRAEEPTPGAQGGGHAHHH